MKRITNKEKIAVDQRPTEFDLHFIISEMVKKHRKMYATAPCSSRTQTDDGLS